ncbi:hypothetical protein [Notoacmeibacter ruber]|uniref:hypothetical protein n=1 Tax=Notoacmeibacter ruber TaxID=2670375 RepID=UPI0011C3A8FC|nr:hypothetical protein [Notoacmeibacter ruber]
MIQKFQTRLWALTYNFAWPDYVWLFGSKLANLSLAVPVVGYLILFNDSVAQHINFSELSGQNPRYFLISNEWRLRSLYFGLIFMGLSNLLYRLRRPFVMRFGTSRPEYVETMFRNALVNTYVHLHEQIRYTGYDAFTRYGKYYDAEWDSFLDTAIGRRVEGNRQRDPIESHWASAKSKFESLLKGILIETYFRESRKRRFSLCFCILFGAIGLFLTLVPSADLFVRVLSVIFVGPSSEV